MGLYYEKCSSRKEWQGVDWIDLAWDRDKWWAVVNSVMNSSVPWNAGNSFAN